MNKKNIIEKAFLISLEFVKKLQILYHSKILVGKKFLIAESCWNVTSLDT